jgi:hypothetical protein
LVSPVRKWSPGQSTSTIVAQPIFDDVLKINQYGFGYDIFIDGHNFR